MTKILFINAPREIAESFIKRHTDYAVSDSSTVDHENGVFMTLKKEADKK